MILVDAALIGRRVVLDRPPSAAFAVPLIVDAVSRCGPLVALYVHDPDDSMTAGLVVLDEFDHITII
jgi:hypothetical protein